MYVNVFVFKKAPFKDGDGDDVNEIKRRMASILGLSIFVDGTVGVRRRMENPTHEEYSQAFWKAQEDVNRVVDAVNEAYNKRILFP